MLQNFITLNLNIIKHKGNNILFYLENAFYCSLKLKTLPITGQKKKCYRKDSK